MWKTSTCRFGRLAFKRVVSRSNDLLLVYSDEEGGGDGVSERKQKIDNKLCN